MSKKGQEALLLWCKKCTAGYPNVAVDNFHTSWTDGLAFCAIIHHFRPDLIHFDELSKDNKTENLALAFKTAEALGIPALLDVEDMVDMPKPEQFSIITYLSQYYHFFKNDGGSGIASITEDEKKRKLKEMDLPKPPPIPDEELEYCAKCSKELEGAVLEVMGKSYHQDCFGCYSCGKSLLTKCLNVDNYPYCEDCGRKAFALRKKAKSAQNLNAKEGDKEQSSQEQQEDLKKKDEELQKQHEQEEHQKLLEEQKKKEDEEKIQKEKDEQEKKEIERKEHDRVEHERIEHEKKEEKPAKPLPTPKKVQTSNSSNNLTVPSTNQQPESPRGQDGKKKPPLPMKPVNLRGEAIVRESSKADLKTDEPDAQKSPRPDHPAIPPKPKNPPTSAMRTTRDEDEIEDEKPPARLPPMPPKLKSQSVANLTLAEPETVPVKMSFRVSTMPENRGEQFKSSDLPNLEGYLEKKGDVGMIKSWKKRYFKLVRDKLIYYTDEQTKDSPLGYIPLHKSTLIEAVKLDKPEKQTLLDSARQTALRSISVSQVGVFQINTTDPERVWYIKASSEEEARKWIAACIIHSKYTDAPVATSGTKGQQMALMGASKEGFLEKMGGGVSGKLTSTISRKLNQLQQYEWRNRYFVLKDGILFKHEGKNDQHPTKIPLYKCHLEEYNPDSNTNEVNTKFQIIAQQKTIILRAKTEEEMHSWLNAILKQKLLVEQVIDGIEI